MIVLGLLKQKTAQKLNLTEFQLSTKLFFHAFVIYLILSAIYYMPIINDTSLSELCLGK